MQAEVAEKMDLPRPYLSRAERGLLVPGLRILSRLLLFYALSLEDILSGGDGEQSRSCEMARERLPLGLLVKKARLKAGFSQKGIALATGIAASRQSRIEHGNNKSISLRTLATLRAVTGIDADDVMDSFSGPLDS